MAIEYETKNYPGLDQISIFSRFITGGDIGGTKQRLVAYGLNEEDILVPVLGIDALGKTVNSISELFENYKTELANKEILFPQTTAIGVAGPINANGCVTITNTGLFINPATLEGEVRILNDFAAIAHGIPHLTDDELVQIGGPNDKSLHGKIVIIGPGTGLGVAMVNISDNNNYMVFPSEGGHVDYAPRNILEMMLKLYIEEKHEGRRAVCEQAGSGVGLPNIASYLAYGELPDEIYDTRIKSIKEYRPEFIEFAKSIGLYEVPLNKENADYLPPQIIGRKLIEAYKNGECKNILGIAMDIMVGADAIAARTNVHTLLGYDGVVIVGGNARRLNKLFCENFPEEFYKSGSHVELIESTPIYVLTKQANKLIGSMGAAYYALNQK